MILSITSRELQVAARCLPVSPWFRSSRIPWWLVPIGCAGRTPVGTSFGAVPSRVAGCSGEDSAVVISTGTFPGGIDRVPVAGVFEGPWVRDVSLVAVISRSETSNFSSLVIRPHPPTRAAARLTACLSSFFRVTHDGARQVVQ